jgi:hypothetical protein
LISGNAPVEKHNATSIRNLLLHLQQKIADRARRRRDHVTVPVNGSTPVFRDDTDRRRFPETVAEIVRQARRIGACGGVAERRRSVDEQHAA